MRNNKYNIRYIVINIILMITAILLMLKYVGPIIYVGEYPSNILPVYSILYSGSLAITEKEVKLAEKDMPLLFGNRYTGSLIKPENDNSGKKYGFYTPIYSIVTIPFFLICKALNIDMLYFPNIANISLILIAVGFILFGIRGRLIEKILLSALILYSPIINYFNWASSEVYIYSMVSIALVYFFNKNYKTSIFLISLTACSQPTLFAVAGGFFIIYILSIYDKNMGLYKNIIYNKENIVKGILSFFPIIFLLLYVYMATGKWQLSTVADTHTQIGMITLRYFYDYLFNLDFGLFPYIPLFLITSFIIFIKSVIIRKYDAVIFFMSILLFIFGYSLINHINCGYTQIHRYTVFTIPFIIFYVLFYFDILTLNRKKYIYVSLILLSFAIFVIYSKKTNDYVHFSWQTKLILDNYPSLYNPQPSTFNSKVNHIDGGYSLPDIIVYKDDNGYVRKILLNKYRLENKNYDIFFSFYGKGIEFLREKYEKVSLEDKWSYINVPTKYNIQYYDVKKEIIFNKAIDFDSDYIGLEGFHGKEKTHVWGYRDNRIYFISKDLKKVKSILLEIGTLGKQDLTVYLNDNELFSGKLDYHGYLDILEGKQNIVLKNGMNYIRIVSKNPIKPDNGDNRELSIAFKTIKFISE